jgi:hypothetical protein
MHTSHFWAFIRAIVNATACMEYRLIIDAVCTGKLLVRTYRSNMLHNCDAKYFKIYILLAVCVYACACTDTAEWFILYNRAVHKA